jgi:hypothetical protein
MEERFFMNSRAFHIKYAITAVFSLLMFTEAAILSGEEAKRTSALPLVYNVITPPTPLKGEGGLYLVYELQIANFSRVDAVLNRVDVLRNHGVVLKNYEGAKLVQCLTRRGGPPDREDKLTLKGGTLAVLFVLLPFQEASEIPDILSHRLTVEYVRQTGEKVKMAGEGGEVSVDRKMPIVIGPPVCPGVWLAGNSVGDGPVGHRDSLQAWDGKLHVSQRYAIDFMKFGGDYSLVKGDKSLNPNWYGYGQEVLSVADGIVTDVKDGIIENIPLSEYAVPNTLEFAAGNYVIVNIGHGFHACYAHLKPGSLQVQVGDRVRKGRVLGLVGNSGISDAPHLHFHILNSNSVFGGEGIPYVFEGFDLLGPYEQLDENLDKIYVPREKSSKRDKEIPMGDVVIKFNQP